jgi:hypothetical protein
MSDIPEAAPASSCRVGPGHRGQASRPDHAVDHAGDDHAGARHHHRQCRAAVDDRRPRRLAGHDQLGADLLHRRRRDHDAGDRLAGRPLRPQARAVPRLDRRLRRLLDALRHRLEPALDGGCSACCRACSARPSCRCRRPSCSTSTRARRPRPGHGDVGRRHHGRPDHRPDAGRLADRKLQLALGVLHQPAGRHRRLPRLRRLSAGACPASGCAASTSSASPCCRSASARCN